MNNQINQIRKKIRALRVSRLQAEANMHDQINRDEDCSAIARRLSSCARRAPWSLKGCA